MLRVDVCPVNEAALEVSRSFCAELQINVRA